MPVGSRAARVEGWRKDLGAWPQGGTLAGTPPPSAVFPQVPLDLSVAIRVEDSWVDVTPSVRGGNRAEVQIRRGRANEASQVEPARLTLELNNRDGQFSPRNPLSWLYGKIGHNTAIQVAVGGDVRFVGEISELPQRWDTSGSDVWVPLVASGILRRLGQGASAVTSIMYGAMTRLSPQPVAYWPCEDVDGSTELASAISGGPAMTFANDVLPDFANNSDFTGTDPIPKLQLSEWRGDITPYTSTGIIDFYFLVSIPDAGAVDLQDIAKIRTSSGSFSSFGIEYRTGGNLRFRFPDTSFSDLVTDLSGFPAVMRVKLNQSGGSVAWEVIAYFLDGTNDSASGAYGGTLGYATRVDINADEAQNDMAIGQISVHKAFRDEETVLNEVAGYLGETAAARIARLCSDEGIEYQLAHGDATETAALSAQAGGNFLSLVQEAAAADGGILYEPRDFLGLAYRTRESLYRQDATATLDYAASDLSSIEPTDDDEALRNDITVSRIGGSSARAVEETGPFSILPPPDGVGRYDDAVSLALEDDTTLAARAAWLLFLGTMDEARYPILAVELARSNFTGANLAKAVAVQALDVGDRLVVDNPPAWGSPDTINQLAQGFTETLKNFTHTIAVNCSPGTPWSQPGIYDDGAHSDGASRYASPGSTLAADLDTTSTSVSVATPAFPRWKHDDGDFGVMVGGERMTVTAISSAAISPQTFTVTRSVNGIVKAHLAGTTVELADFRVYVP